LIPTFSTLTQDVSKERRGRKEKKEKKRKKESMTE
jgi:hypothetical protein